MARLQQGDIIDDFTLGSMIHKGGMARLWSVTHPNFDFPMLMKVPLMGEGDDPAAIVSFEMEQMILPRLKGPHVPRFVANGDFSVQPYIVMEHLSVPSLYPMLEKLPLEPLAVADLGARIAIALDSLHRQDVVHLDLKPSNILLRDTGEAVLIDYGLACHVELPDLMGEEFRLPYGTGPYMAPEQILSTRIDFRSDLFALGSLLYFFATGTRPFGDPQRLKGLKKRLWRDPYPPRALKSDIPPALQEVILRCLEVNPAWRYSSAAQVAVDLQNLDKVKLTARAEKLKRDGLAKVIKRRFNPEPLETVKPANATTQSDNALIVAVAIDLSDGSEDLQEALRQTTGRIMKRAVHGRLACINVLKINRISLDSTLDEDGKNKHVQRLVDLKNWAAPLNLDPDMLTCHVLEAVSPADAILNYARNNHVDHIVMGARANSTLRSFLGSVSAEVAGNAPCTVTVVRKRDFANSI